jgi:hypothetical protein
MPIDGSTDVAESAVRNYLLFIEDPDKLVDKELIAQLRKKAQETPDPVERLKVYAELHRAECSDEDKYKADFIRHAKAWAAANNGARSIVSVGRVHQVLRSFAERHVHPRRYTGERRG